MILQTSLDEQTENICRLSLHSTGSTANSVNTLVSGYRSFLANQRQNNMVHVRREMGHTVVSDPKQAHELGQSFTASEETAIDDLNQLSAIDSLVPSTCGDSLENLKKGTTALHALSPYHHALFELLISDIVLLPSTQANGGSTSDALGVIWANPSPSWRPLDTLEFLVHELTHQCMFIDEICNQHYDYSKIVNKDYWTTSAILNRPRPADKVLHSIVVSTEILLLRERILGHPASPRCHPPTTLMRLQVGRAIDELLAISSRTEAKGLLAPRAVSLLRNCQMLTAAIDVSPLEH